MLLAKQGMRPNDGFWFEEIDKSVHKARSWPELERRVSKYRSLNGFPKGEVLKEILEQAQKRNPEFFWSKRVRGE